MELIQIEDNDKKYIIKLDGNKLSGYKFLGDKFSGVVDKSVLNYFSFLYLSNNKTQLSDEGDYHVFLDNETNYRHYFKDGKEDFEMFFLNNGEEATVYDDNDKEEKPKKTKTFYDKFVKVYITFSSIVLLMSGVYLSNPTYFDGLRDHISINEVKQFIYNADLTDEQKEYLFNEPYYRDALVEINQSDYTRTLFRERNTGLNIEYVDTDKGGFYSYGNTLYINKKYKGTPQEKGIAIHENNHKDQASHNLFLLDETLAEIIRYEYNADAHINSYVESVQYTYELLELLGAKPFWHYNMTGDYSQIMNAAKPYLSEEELIDFERVLQFRYFYESREKQQPDYDRLRELIDIIKDKKNVKYDARELQSKTYFNKVDLHNGLYENQVLAKDLLDRKDVKVLKVDKQGNIIGEATYTDFLDLCDSKYENKEINYTFVIDDTNNKLGWNWSSFFINSSGRVVLSYGKGDESKITSYEEYYVSHPEVQKPYEDPEEDFSDNENMYYNIFNTYFEEYKEKEVKNIYNKPFNYADGSSVIVDENDTVTRTDKNGKVTTYQLVKGTKLHVGWNGFIYWTNVNNEAYRLIQPDGTVLEKYVINDNEREVYRYISSNGESFDTMKYSSNPIQSFRDVDGKKYILLQNVVMPLKNQKGEKIGTRGISYGSLEYYDLNGKNTMYVSLGNSAESFVRMDRENGLYDLIYDGGFSEQYDADDNLIAVNFQNGYHIDIEDEKTFTIFDEQGNVVRKITNADADDISFYNDGLIQITDDDNNIIEFIYYGKHSVIYQDKKLIYKGPVNQMNEGIEENARII